MFQAEMSPQFSVVIPFYNEASFLPETLRSWLGQTRLPDEIVVVDNGSTDGSVDVCREHLDGFSGNVVYAADDRPGKVNALETGCRRASGRYLVFADADTYYPPHYLALAEDLIRRTGDRTVALMAQGTGNRPDRLPMRIRRGFYVSLSHILRKQTFTGGYGQIIRSDVLTNAGGFSERQWPYVLVDHEIMQRVFKYGDSLYHIDFWCIPSGRRKDRSRVRWTLPERLLYHITPFRLKDRFFYDFLGPRLAARGMTHLNLRDRSWESAGEDHLERP